MVARTTYVTLHTGARMPLVGYGTWQSKEGEMEGPLNEALRAGYRHIDTAAAYGNEDVIGKVLQEEWFGPGKLKREDLFVVTKLFVGGLHPGGPAQWIKASLEKLRLDYVDMFLIHTVFNFTSFTPQNRQVADYVDHVAMWKEMEALVDQGLTKAIGLSNFNQRQIQNILDHCRIKPANLQVELHAHMQQRPLVDFCKKNGIVVSAYSPVGSPGAAQFIERLSGGKTIIEVPSLVNHPVIVDLAKKYNKQTNQILLKHIVQRGVVALPKSLNSSRIAASIDLFDWDMSPEDIAKIDALDKGKDGRIYNYSHLGVSPTHAQFPYHEYP
ncbi:aldo-keto reductase family 1 member A1-like [Thrips palmi]|uniref:Aldo-keto reductase family 1 member A1-like n=1 Tax=Thrips palmi TaxID=161013 RepID=A0A6P8YQY1_THRPL|nr:aldo-keto reductase family 1 member A1-like [Thrips palmi]